jgi:hypothetical protein
MSDTNARKFFGVIEKCPGAQTGPQKSGTKVKTVVYRKNRRGIRSRGSLLFFKKFKFSNFGCVCVFFPRILLVKNLVHSLTFEGEFNEA